MKATEVNIPDRRTKNPCIYLTLQKSRWHNRTSGIAFAVVLLASYHLEGENINHSTCILTWKFLIVQYDYINRSRKSSDYIRIVAQLRPVIILVIILWFLAYARALWTWNYPQPRSTRCAHTNTVANWSNVLHTTTEEMARYRVWNVPLHWKGDALKMRFTGSTGHATSRPRNAIYDVDARPIYCQT